MILFNENQRKCIEHPPAPLMIIAGAGTGKTTTLIARIAYFINERNIDSESILALTYTVKAAEHLKENIAELVGDKSKNINASNFHSFALDQVISYYDTLGYSEPPTLIEANESKYIVKEIISDNIDILYSSVYKKDIHIAFKNVPKMFDRFRDELILKDELIKKRDSILGDADNSEIDLQMVDCINLFIKYQEFKSRKSWIDFGDMIIDLWTLLNKEETLKEIQSTIRHIVVDEYQDNNFALSQIVIKLAGTAGSLTVVGDDDQSIYSFRGANVIGFNEFRDYYKSFKGYSEIILDINYRSPQSTLDFANQTVKQNSFRIKDRALTSNKEIDENVYLFSGDKTKQLTKMVSLTMDYLKNGVEPSEICVLTRSRTNALDVSNYFNHFSINNSYRSGKLFDSEAAKNFISFLNVIDNNMYSDTGLYRLVSQSNCKELLINTDSMTKIKQELQEDNLKGSDLLNRIKDCRKLRKEDPVTLFSDFSDRFLEDDANPKILMIMHEMIEKYNLLYRTALKGNICDYLNSMFEINDIYIDDDVEYKDTVSIMTVHQSKGMEFDHIMIPFLASSTFPIAKGKSENLENIPDEWIRNEEILEIDKIEEERRIFHVASTRAKKTLHLFAPPKRRSRFFKEIDTETYSEVELTEDNQLSESYQEYSFRYNNPIELSYSATSLSMYEKCPLSFKLSKIDRISDSGYSPSASFGMYVHATLEDIFKGNVKNRGEISKLLDEKWDDSKFENIYQSTEYKKEACDVLCDYVRLNPPNSTVKYLFEESLKVAIGKYTFYGKLDRVDILDDNSIRILDYKTSKSKKSKGYIKKDIQLAFYSFLMKNIDSDEIEARIPDVCTLEFVRDSEDPSVDVSFTAADMIEMGHRIEGIIKSIEKNQFSPKKNVTCYFCDYKKLLCPLYK